MKSGIKNHKIDVKRSNIIFRADPTRIVTRLFMFGDEDRILRTINRVLDLDEVQVISQLDFVLKEFAHRHKDIESTFETHFNYIKHLIQNDYELSREQKLLIGSYFTQEYSIESAALFNPSIVIAPDQSKVPPDSVRVIISFRSTGEGHVSSIEFRSGILTADNDLVMDEISPYLETSKIFRNMSYDKDTFGMKLLEKRIPETGKNIDWLSLSQKIDVITNVLENLSDRFSFRELQEVLSGLQEKNEFSISDEELDAIFSSILWMARSNYEVHFDPDMPLSERVIFPVTDNENRGIEDARFVRFEDNSQVMYYATYSAYNGYEVQSQLLETKNFEHFNIHTINGIQSRSKGMALFPRKINGRYAMVCRSDGENNYILFSDDLKFWHEAKLLQEPRYPWEFIQIGNCGSPIETRDGWLLITHGVGPMRRYTLGATLLDLEDPLKVISQTPIPILEPNQAEREGYVPNVVYSCGSIIHNDELVIPYAMSDSASSIATINISQLLDCFKSNCI